ncbi:MAG: alpha-maltose-phosphate synthase [Verrucomicrobiota bacterium]|jgi:glycosyltransferase involved in cell wall biosynthesis
MSKILLSHPTANQNVRQTSLAFAEANLLDEFWTCINWRPGSLLDRIAGLSPRVQDQLRRRSFAAELQPFTRSFASREWVRLVFGAVGLDSVYDSLDRHVARRLNSRADLKAVYAYDAGALETFRAAKRRGLKCIYEYPIVHWRKVRELQREEAELQPEWAPTLLGLRDSEAKLARKDEELSLADVIVTACSFARESLPLVNASVHVIPYGAPDVSEETPPASTEKLRVLFVGALTQAKGLSYVFDATARLQPHVDLTLIGHRVSETIPAQPLLDRHRWIPSLSHDRLLAEMSAHDVLLLPSLHEGFGLVILEAMARGTPVITTAHTGGADLIDDGVDGFLIPIRSADAIVEKLEWLMQDRQRHAAMRAAARNKARACSWQIYRQRIVALAREVIAN